MGMFGLVGSESKSSSQVWQQQLTATDGSTVVRDQSKKKTKTKIGSDNKSTTTLALGGVGAGSTVNLSVNDGGATKDLAGIVGDGLKSLGDGITGSMTGAGSPVVAVTDAGNSWQKTLLWSVLAGLAVWAITKYLKK